MSETQNTIYGIDLGTTYSCIAHIDEFGRPSTIPNAEGDRTTPSVVFFEGDNRIVGREAKNTAVLAPDQVIEMVKRQMGTRDWAFFYDGREYSAEEISSYVLRKVVGDAEMALGREIKDVVITCPAYFGVNEREATAKAGEIAGLNVRSIINEPTAAAIAYTMDHTEEQVVLIYDLGGGTFDITMIEVKGDRINVIATGGNHHLGGRNWDELVLTYLAEQWMVLSGSDEDPLDDLDTVQDLFGRAEAAKKTLTAREKADVPVTHAGQRERVTLTREKFDELTASLLEETIEHTHRMLEQAARKGCDHFDRILLVGGSTRMPQVAIRLQKEFNMDPEMVDPDEIVAKGAAIYGQKLVIGDEIRVKLEGWNDDAPASLEQAQRDVAEAYGLPQSQVEQFDRMEIHNVTSRSFGVTALDMDTNEEIVSNIIRVNDTVPAQATERFGTVNANQATADIRIMENLSPEEKVAPSTSEEIGNALLHLPPGLPANAPIEITFSLDEQGRLHASARELSDNRTVEVEIQTARVISGEALEEAKARSAQIYVS